MNRPIYEEFDLAKPHEGHAGLWYEKCCNTWRFDPGWTLVAAEGVSPKLDWVNTVTKNTVKANFDMEPDYVKDPAKALLTEHHDRLTNLCKPPNGLTLSFKTTSRLVIGIGQDHPVENGFLWHPTLGVPYIPGSSIKGMLRNWMLEWADGATNKAWFESDIAKGVGQLIFLDALPLEVPKLEADVITPHYGPYYRDPNTQPPADWHSPVPTPFLTVAVGAKFAIRVIARRGKPTDPPFDFAAVEKALKDALKDAFDVLGIGAKTAVGYGRLKPSNEPQVPAAVSRVTDPLAEFKLFCTGFGNIASKKGSQNLMVEKLKALPADQRPAALDYLRTDLKTKPKDCVQELKNLLFPTEGVP